MELPLLPTASHQPCGAVPGHTGAGRCLVSLQPWNKEDGKTDSDQQLQTVSMEQWKSQDFTQARSKSSVGL